MKLPRITPIHTSLALLPMLAAIGYGGELASSTSSDSAGKVPAIRYQHFHEGPPPRAGGRLGDPLLDLTQQQMLDFTVGLGQFEKVETPESGLGPIYNNTSCAICHSTPVTGGSSAELVARFGRDDGGRFDPLTALGGSLLQHQSIDPSILERIPKDATILARRQPTPLFGMGLVEAIPDEAIQALAERKKPDGILGRAALVKDVTTGQMRIGRFGWKAQHATILGMVTDEYVNELGITNQAYPEENAPNGDLDELAAFDHVADPEDTAPPGSNKSDADLVADYIRFLAPPAVPRPTAEVQKGLALFTKLGCAECHVPTQYTGDNKVRALHRKPVVLFSDLLLHDMGSLGDGIAQADALPKEIRTAPLWALRTSAPYLHDGRAPTIPDAIRAHDGEGAAARDRFNGLSPSQQRDLIDFLSSL